MTLRERHYARLSMFTERAQRESPTSHVLGSVRRLRIAYTLSPLETAFGIR